MGISTTAQLARWTAIWAAEPTGWSFGHLAGYTTTLRPGGVFLPQQVTGTEAGEFREWFGGRPPWPQVQRDVFVAAAADAGLRVTVSDDWTGAIISPMSIPWSAICG